MVIPREGVARVTVALDPVDVDLLDRLARIEGSNRSAELRSVLRELRPVLQQTVSAFEAALKTRDEFAAKVAAYASATEVQELMPEVERLQSVLLGSLARLEGAAAAREAAAGQDPRSSNHGGHTPPTNPPVVQ